MRRASGVITVYASLTFVLILSLAGALLQSAAIQTSKNTARATASQALESTFAEYDPDLLERYHIFAVDAGRDGGSDPEAMILERMHFYGADTDEAEVEKVRYLTDENGRSFYEQALTYVKEKELTQAAKALAEKAGILEEGDESEEENLISRLAAELKGIEGVDAEAGVFALFAELMMRPTAENFLPKGCSVSKQSVDKEAAASSRSLRTGRGTFAAEKKEAGATYLFDAYLADVMSCGSDREEKDGPLYELEYILQGKESERDNLEGAAKRILSVRTGFNASYLKSDESKQAQIKAAAAFLAVALAAPESEEQIAGLLTFVWAYGEAMMDLRALCDGKKIALKKTADSWTLGMGGLLSFERSLSEGWESADNPDGYSYREYLQMLLSFEDKEKKTMRALDLLEINLSRMHEGKSFKADACVSRIQVKSLYRAERGISYRYTNGFSYR